MKQQLEAIKLRAMEALDAAETPAALDELRVKLLGKKGELTAVLKMMGKLSAEERPVMGQLANAVRAEIEAKLEERKTAIDAAVLEAKLAAESIDVTIPGETVEMGHQHPMNMVLQEIKDIFVGLGYTVVDGPEVELASYNFTRLNIEEGHPSRDRSDTFYFTDDDSVLLRTQTSSMQIRFMEEHKPPLCMLEQRTENPRVAGSIPALGIFYVKLHILYTCGCSSMVEHQPSKLDTWVRFPSPAFKAKCFKMSP